MSTFELDEGEGVSSLRGRGAGVGAARACIWRVCEFSEILYFCSRFAFGGMTCPTLDFFQSSHVNWLS